MPEPFRYRVSADDECHVLLRFPDGEVVAVRVQAGSELLLDGPPGKQADNELPVVDPAFEAVVADAENRYRGLLDKLGDL